MKEQFVIAAVGENITGIVSAVSREIFECGCSFEDSTLTFLGLNFCMMALITGEDKGLYEELQMRCDRLGAEKNLSVSLFRMGPVPDGLSKGPSPNYEIRVKGRNRLGIVYRTSQLLASLEVNIVEMETSIEPPVRKGDTEDFIMRVAVVIPENVDTTRLRKS